MQSRAAWREGHRHIHAVSVQSARAPAAGKYVRDPPEPGLVLVKLEGQAHSHASAGYRLDSSGTAAARTTSTGRLEALRIPLETLPRSADASAPCPREPTTMRSASIVSAWRVISATGSPRRSAVPAGTPSRSATA